MKEIAPRTLKIGGAYTTLFGRDPFYVESLEGTACTNCGETWTLGSRKLEDALAIGVYFACPCGIRFAAQEVNGRIAVLRTAC